VHFRLFSGWLCCIQSIAITAANPMLAGAVFPDSSIVLRSVNSRPEKRRKALAKKLAK
jgi:hypothetical protein